MNEVAERIYAEVAGDGVIGDPLGRPAFAYLRVSSPGQAEEDASGLPRQLERIGEKAKQEGYVIPPEMVFVDDGFSGYEYFRPAINALLEEVQAGRRRSDTVITEDIDRLARDTDIQGFFFTILTKRHGMNVLFVRHPGSKLERILRGAMSDQFMELAKQRMAEGVVRKARSGRVTARRAAYGYMLVDSEGKPSNAARKDTHYALHPEQSKVVRLVFDKVVYEDWGLFRVAQHLAELGIPSPRGGKFWDRTVLWRMVREPLYKGEFIAGRFLFRKTGRFNAQGRPTQTYTVRPESQWTKISVPAVVTAEEWETAQAALRKHRTYSARNSRKGKWLLTGLIKCARCGRAYGAALASRAHKDRVRYYECGSNRRIRAEKEEGRCDSRQVQADALERLVWHEVAQVLADPQRLIARMEQRGKEEQEALYRERVGRIDAELAECDREKERWDRAYGRSSLMDLDEYEDKIGRVRARRRELEETRKQVLSRLAEIGQIEAKRQALLERLKAFEGTDLGEHIPYGRKRRILELVADEIRLDTVECRLEIHGAIRAAISTQAQVTAETGEFQLQSSLRWR